MPDFIATDFELPALHATVTTDGAHDMLSTALAESDALRATAREEGYAAGLEEARAVVLPAADALHAACAALDEERARIAEHTEQAAVELAFAIAEQVLGATLEVEPERVVDIVRGALRRLVERESVTILIHPDDLELVRDAAPGLVSELGGIEHCEVQAERRVSRGGAVVRTGDGEVDATLDTKLLKAREAVLAALTAVEDA